MTDHDSPMIGRSGAGNMPSYPQDDPAPVYVCCKCLEPCDLHETGWSSWAIKLSACCRTAYYLASE